jgi:hypothetical protein
MHHMTARFPALLAALLLPGAMAAQTARTQPVAAPAPVVSATATADVPAVRLDVVMSADEQQRTGVSRVTPAERAALERWLAHYTAAVAQGARLGLSAESAAPIVVAPSQAVSGTGARRPWVIPPGARLSALERGGDFVRLEDGSRWRVNLPDRPRVAAWRSGQWIAIRRVPVSTDGFDIELRNGTEGTRALVRLVDVAQ